MGELENFAQQLADLPLSQPNVALALLWYRDHTEEGATATARELGDEMHDLGLSNAVNVSRLHGQLVAHKDTVRGKATNTFKLKASSRPTLDDTYSKLIGKRRAKPSDSIIPRSQFDGRRKPWCDLVVQINGCYDHEFYDGAAVLCRRLVESLIVEVFKAKGIDSRIKTPSGDYMMLDGLIKVLGQCSDIRISRSGKPGLEPIQRLGNIAAHSPYYITTKQDAADIARHARPLVSELLVLIDESKN